jgi:DNA modification methylase
VGRLRLRSRHRVLCGDSTKAEDVERLMDGERAELMLSDPPYNVGYEYSDHKDNMSDAKYQAFCDAYMKHGQAVSDMQIITPGKSNERRYSPIEYMTWYKGFGLSRGSFYKAMVTEPILLFGKKPKNKFYNTDHFQFHTEREPGLRELHTCPKPVKLFAALIEPMTDVGSLVYEAFCGSGTTLIAAEQLGRKCYGMEMSPQYCDVIVRRFENLTGEEAVRWEG